MPVDIDITYEGDLRCRLVHGPSGDVLVTDAPMDNEGQGRHFSPTDLTAASMGSCILTIMGIAARKRDLDIQGARAVVTKEMSAVPRRHISRLRMTITLPAHLDSKARKILERIADACPVRQSLGERTRTAVEFVYE
jgi:putative redox protein